jgi:hypothetical protein
MRCIAASFGLIVTIAVLAAEIVVAQEEPSAAGQNLEPNAGSDACRSPA